MLHVRLANRTLGVVFQYEYDLIEVAKSTGSGEQGEVEKAKTPKATYCELHRVEQGKSTAVVARSQALLAHRNGAHDAFTYETGRKLSLRRALKSYGLTRGERTLVWAAYLNRPRGSAAPSVKAKLADPAEAPAATLAVLNEDLRGPIIMEGSPSARRHAALDLHAGEA